jgi:hypothetical protein
MSALTFMETVCGSHHRGVREQKKRGTEGGYVLPQLEVERAFDR